ncbi:unnamed protein product [Calypogeia fissa]
MSMHPIVTDVKGKKATEVFIPMLVGVVVQGCDYG